jgi:hypothetical protein
MITKIQNSAQIRKAAGQVLLAALFVLSTPLIADHPETEQSSNTTIETSNERVLAANQVEFSKQLSTSWTSSDQKLILHIDTIGEGHRVCPQFPDASQQPFCRQFNVPVRGVCGTREHVYLVLANGDLHLVNNALIGINGDFDAIYHPEPDINLVSAWFPEDGCPFGENLPGILGLNDAGSLVRFNGEKWQSVDESTPQPPPS